MTSVVKIPLAASYRLTQINAGEAAPACTAVSSQSTLHKGLRDREDGLVLKFECSEFVAYRRASRFLSSHKDHTVHTRISSTLSPSFFEIHKMAGKDRDHATTESAGSVRPGFYRWPRRLKIAPVQYKQALNLSWRSAVEEERRITRSSGVIRCQ